MKKLITIAMLTLLTACAQPEGSNMMDKGMMCDQCPCCQQMMKESKECSCCKDMKECCCKGMKDGKKMCDMKEGMKGGQETKKPVSSKDHQQHHPAQ